jgi:sugar phosphate permease
MYAAYYMCRYNFRFATPGMQAEFGFTTTQISDLIGIWSLTYGTGQLVNGLLTDRIGGKRSMQIGAFGTIVISWVCYRCSWWAGHWQVQRSLFFVWIQLILHSSPLPWSGWPTAGFSHSARRA